jgi:hypothetical protein
LDNLKNEIKNAGLEQQLTIYMQKKEAEVENDKLMLKIEHMNKINHEYKIETEIMSNITVNACDVIQDDYLLLRSLKELDNDTLGKYQKLVKMLQGQRSVKFADDEINLTTNITEEKFSFLPLNAAENGDGDNDHHCLESPTMVSRKRAVDSDNNNDHVIDSKKSKNDFAFAQPKALKSIDFGANDMNATFNLDSGPPPILNERTNSLAPGSKFAPKCKLVI